MKRPKGIKRAGILALAVLFLAAPRTVDPHSAKLLDGESIEIKAAPLKVPATYPLGGLKLIAALRLSSKDVRFGGWSALHVEPNGDFIALSDRAFTMQGRMSFDANGAPDGLADARIGALNDTNGQAPSTLRGDSEGLTRLRDGRYMLSFELKPRLMIYDFAHDGFGAVPRDGPALSQTEQLASNQQLEAITTLSDGSLLVGSERGENGDAKAMFWRVPTPLPDADAKGISPLAKLKLPPSFSLTELAGAEDGSFYALYRAYSPLSGAAAQIRHLRFSEQGGKSSVDGELLAQLKPPFPTDNYEAMSLASGPDGGQRLYIMSDDNYRAEQSTILLVFDVEKRTSEKPAQ